MSALPDEEWRGVRFVVVATLQRGVLKVPEALDDANQWRAFSAWREDESRQKRVEWELGYDDSGLLGWTAKSKGAA